MRIAILILSLAALSYAQKPKKSSKIRAGPSSSSPEEDGSSPPVSPGEYPEVSSQFPLSGPNPHHAYPPGPFHPPPHSRNHPHHQLPGGGRPVTRVVKRQRPKHGGPRQHPHLNQGPFHQGGIGSSSEENPKEYLPQHHGGGHGHPGHLPKEGKEEAAKYPLILSDQRTLNHDGSINFNYATDNGLQQGETVDPDGTRRGFYSYIGEDGKQMTVRYVAGKNGFVAEGDHLPVQPSQSASSGSKEEPVKAKKPKHQPHPPHHYGGGSAYNQLGHPGQYYGGAPHVPQHHHQPHHSYPVQHAPTHPQHQPHHPGVQGHQGHHQPQAHYPQHPTHANFGGSFNPGHSGHSQSRPAQPAPYANFDGGPHFNFQGQFDPYGADPYGNSGEFPTGPGQPQGQYSQQLSSRAPGVVDFGLGPQPKPYQRSGRAFSPSVGYQGHQGHQGHQPQPRYQHPPRLNKEYQQNFNRVFESSMPKEGMFTNLSPYLPSGTGPYNGAFDLGNGGHFSMSFTPGEVQEVQYGPDGEAVYPENRKPHSPLSHQQKSAPKEY